MQRTLPAVLAALVAAASAGPAAASPLVLTFSEFGHGDVVAGSQGVTIVAENPNRPFNLAAAFLTTESATSDPDLEIGAGWALGNLAPDENLAQILILQENNADCELGVSPCSDPDDEGMRPAGSFDFGLPDVYTGFSFDLVDVEEQGEEGSIAFFLAGSPTAEASFAFGDFLTWGQNVAYGNNSANRIDFEGRLDGVSYDRVVITMQGSGGVDNLTFLPEPGTAALLGLGLAGLARPRRRRSEGIRDGSAISHP